MDDAVRSNIHMLELVKLLQNVGNKMQKHAISLPVVVGTFLAQFKNTVNPQGPDIVRWEQMKTSEPTTADPCLSLSTANHANSTQKKSTLK